MYSFNENYFSHAIYLILKMPAAVLLVLRQFNKTTRIHSLKNELFV